VVAAVAFNVLNALSPAALGLPYPTLLGLLTGAASLVPVIGIKLVWIPMLAWLAAVAFQAGSGYWFVAVFGGVAAVVVDFVPDLVVRPYVSGRDLHLGLVMLAYVFGPLIWGWYGIFLGPMVLVPVVHFGRLVLPELVAGVEIEPVPNGRPAEQSSDHGSAPDGPGADADTAPGDGDDDNAGGGADEGANDEHDNGDDGQRSRRGDEPAGADGA
jgi:hypothetical protein